MTKRAAAALSALSHGTDKPLVVLCADEVAAEALAATLVALAPQREVIFLPSSDQLPGDDAPASPANTGKRLAALTRLRSLSRREGLAGAIIVSTGEAAARRYPPPQAFDEKPPSCQRATPWTWGRCSR